MENNQLFSSSLASQSSDIMLRKSSPQSPQQQLSCTTEEEKETIMENCSKVLSGVGYQRKTKATAGVAVATSTTRITNQRHCCERSNNRQRRTTPSSFSSMAQKNSLVQFVLILTMAMMMATLYVKAENSSLYTASAGSSPFTSCKYGVSAITGDSTTDDVALAKIGTVLRINNVTIDEYSIASTVFEIGRGSNVSIDVVSLSSMYSFTNALIRIEMTSGNKNFTVIPKKGISRIANRCTSPAIGLTALASDDSANETASLTTLGGIAYFQTLGNVTIDVTVIVNETRHAFASYNNFQVVKKSETSTSPISNTTTTTTSNTTTVGTDSDTTPVPTKFAIETFAPTITPVPTSTSPPTYNSLCNVCSSLNGGADTDLETLDMYTLSSSAKSFTFVNVITTCGELHQTALAGYLPPVLCTSAQEAMLTNGCGCTLSAPVPSPPTTSDGSSGGLISTPVAVSTPRPSYGTKCYVCNGDPTLKVTSLTSSISITTDQVFTCEQLQNVGLTGRISPVLCETFISAIQRAPSVCNCQPISAPVPTPSSASGGNGVLYTFKPSTTRQPVFTKMPVHAPSNVCYGCGMNTMIVSDRDRTANYFGYAYTCGSLIDAQYYINANDASCPAYMQAVQSQCQCIATSTSSTGGGSSGSGQLVPTFAPTVTALPTITATPTYNDVCYVCGTMNQIVSRPLDPVQVLNRWYTCGEIQNGGLDRFIPPSLCPDFIASAVKSCYCISSSTAATTKSGTEDQQSSAVNSVSNLSSVAVVTMISIILSSLTVAILA